MITISFTLRAATRDDVRRALLHLAGLAVTFDKPLPGFVRDQAGHGYAVTIRDESLERELEASVQRNSGRKLKLVKT